MTREAMRLQDVFLLVVLWCGAMVTLGLAARAMIFLFCIGYGC
jgi:hypothetical protein